MVYIIIGIIFIFLSYIEIIKYQKWFSNLFLYVFSIVLILFAGLRNGNVVGTDSPAYYFHYQFPHDYDIEYGYKFLGIFFSKILNANYNLFLIFINAISIFLIAKSLKKNSVFLIVPLLVYYSDFYLYYNFSGIRQALALSFVYFSFYYALHKKYFLFFSLIIIAMMFHITSIVFVAAIFIPDKKFSFRNFFHFALLFFFGFVLVKYTIENIEYLKNKFMFYSEIQENSINIKSNYIIGILKRSIVLLMVFLLRKKLLINNTFIYFFNVYLFGFIIYVLTYLISPDFGVRFSSYYTTVDTILIGNMLFAIKNPIKRSFLFLLIVAMVIYKINTYAFLEVYQYEFCF